MMSSRPRIVGGGLVGKRGAADVHDPGETGDRAAGAYAPPEEVASVDEGNRSRHLELAAVALGEGVGLAGGDHPLHDTGHVVRAGAGVGTRVVGRDRDRQVREQ